MSLKSRATPNKDQGALLRAVPSVDELLGRPRMVALCDDTERGFVVGIVREVLKDIRGGILSGDLGMDPDLLMEVIQGRVASRAKEVLAPSLVPVINASGVILHTNLGRAPLAAGASEEITRSAERYSNLEFDVAAGHRGKRDTHTAQLLAALTGAETAIVVNNCAAAVLVTLAALARGGEVIVSRGELIEIGDGFRIPEIMEQSGAILREVGTTNRTRIADYEKAINEKTRMLLRVHPSNFTVSGFTEKPEVAELVALGKSAKLPVVEDLGSGCLVDLASSGIQEPTVRTSVAAGFSLVLFSGDKLLGGPQAGLIVGSKELVAKVRRHPLFRALRVDKLTIAALEVTLRSYLRGALDEVPALRMIRMPFAEISERTENFLRQLRPLTVDAGAEFELVNGTSLVGGGSTPAQSLPTRTVRVASRKYSASRLEERLRLPSRGLPVITRIEEDRILIDLRTVFPEQERELAMALAEAVR